MTGPTPITDFSEFRVIYNRERYRQEIAEGIYRLMESQGVSRTKLAELLEISKGRVSQILSGDENLQADTVADLLLVLGRTPHLSLGTDSDGVRAPVDEGTSAALLGKRTIFIRQLNRTELGYGEEGVQKIVTEGGTGGAWVSASPRECGGRFGASLRQPRGRYKMV